MSNLYQYAESELRRTFPDETDEMQQYAISNILELIDTFSNQGHSGFSAPYVLQYFSRLAKWKPIGPLTGEDDEWGKPDGEKQTQQNKRCSSVFRDHFDNSTARHIEGIVFIDQDGYSYTCRDSQVPITFPYEVPDQPIYERRDRE